MFKPLVIALWILAGLSIAGYAWMRANRPAPPAQGGQDIEIVVRDEAGNTVDLQALPPLFATPAFELTDHHGQAFSSEQLKGKVWIGFIFLTNCPTGACPVMVGKMAKLQEALPDERVHFVSFSVDPERDTPEVLATYAEEVGGAGVSDRWHLLTGGSRKQMADLAASMKLAVGEDFGHSTVFLLVDGDGMVRGLYGNDDPEGMARLQEATRRLLEMESGR